MVSLRHEQIYHNNDNGVAGMSKGIPEHVVDFREL